MIAHDQAEQCLIPAACKGGSFDEVGQSCSEGHIGHLCGACQAGYSRKRPKTMCRRCDAVSTLRFVVMINLELVCRAGLALLLAQRALRHIHGSPCLDFVVLRVWMSWTA